MNAFSLCNHKFVVSLSSGEYQEVSHDDYRNFIEEVVKTVSCSGCHLFEVRMSLMAAEVEIEGFIRTCSEPEHSAVALAVKAKQFIGGTDRLLPSQPPVASQPQMQVVHAWSNLGEGEKKRPGRKLKYVGKDVHLIEKAYGMALMGEFKTEEGEYPEIWEVLEYLSEAFGIPLEKEKAYQTWSRIKRRNGKDLYPMHDRKANIHSRAYYHNEQARRINEFIVLQDREDGRATKISPELFSQS